MFLQTNTWNHKNSKLGGFNLLKYLVFLQTNVSTGSSGGCQLQLLTTLTWTGFSTVATVFFLHDSMPCRMISSKTQFFLLSDIWLLRGYKVLPLLACWAKFNESCWTFSRHNVYRRNMIVFFVDLAFWSQSATVLFLTSPSLSVWFSSRKEAVWQAHLHLPCVALRPPCLSVRHHFDVFIHAFTVVSWCVGCSPPLPSFRFSWLN